MKNSHLLCLSFLFVLLLPSLNFAQLPDGSYAPDFTLPATDGSTYTLYDYLDDGKSVVLDFSATWCPPCWSYHNGGTLDDVYDNLGPGGTNQAMVFMVEADSGTSEDCIYGASTCTGGTLGDWTAGVNYPILNPNSSDASGVASDYAIGYWPTLYGVAPNGQIYEIGQAGSSTWESYLAGSFQMVLSEYEVLDNGCVYDIDVLPVGGDGDIDYEWSNGATTEDLYGVVPGDYYVTMTDDNNFEFVLGPIEVNGLEPIEIITIEESNVICYGDASGFINAEALGGTGDFNYDWSTGDTGPILLDLVADTYELTVTDNVSGCTEEITYFIDEPEEIEVETVVYDALCGSEGQVTFDTEGGAPPFSYIFPDFTSPNSSITLEPGYYFVTIEDVEGCQITDEFEIFEIAGPGALAIASDQVTCTTPAVNVSGAGSETGSGITYTWYDANQMVVGNAQDLTVTNGGTYTLVVYDADSGCSSSASATVTENTTLPSVSVGYSNPINCTMSTTTLTGTSTNPNLTYQWSTNNGVLVSGATAATATASAGGNYFLTATDPMNGCSTVTEIIVPADTALPNSTISGNTNFCEGSTTTLCVPADAASTITWIVDGVGAGNSDCITVNTTSNVTAQVTNTSSGCSSSQSVATTQNTVPAAVVQGQTSFCTGSSTSICATLQPGETAQWMSNGMVLSNTECIVVTQTMDIELIITNSAGCSSSSPYSISALPSPDSSITGALGICSDGSTTLCVPQSADHTYSWSIDGLAAGGDACIEVTNVSAVSVEVVNANGCISTTEVIVEQFDNPTASISSTNILDCDNPSASLDLNTDNPDNTFSWISPDGIMYSTDEDISVSIGGLWTVMVTSPNGCVTETSINVEQDADSFANPDFTESNVDLEVSFLDQSTGQNISSYQWDFGDGNSSSEQSPTHVYAEVGIYTVCLTVSNNCGVNTRCKDVGAAFPILLTTSVSNVTCNGGTNGSISIEIEGGIPPFQIDWNGLGTTPDLANLPAGTYPIAIIDAAGTVFDGIYQVSEPEPISVEASIQDATNGEANGAIDLTTTGGNGNFTYNWDNGMNGPSISGLEPGFYTVQVIDDEGCESSSTFEVMASTSLNDLELINELTISPNPVTDLQTFNISLSEKSVLLVEWIDVQGRVIMNEKFDAKDINITKDISNLDAGLYFLRLTVEGKTAAQRFIKI